MEDKIKKLNELKYDVESTLRFAAIHIGIHTIFVFLLSLFSITLLKEADPVVKFLCGFAIIFLSYQLIKKTQMYSELNSIVEEINDELAKYK